MHLSHGGPASALSVLESLMSRWCSASGVDIENRMERRRDWSERSHEMSHPRRQAQLEAQQGLAIASPASSSPCGGRLTAGG